MPRRLLNRLLPGALLCVLSGCSQASLESIEQGQLAVVSGQPSGPEDDGVVQVWANAGTVINRCTGSLVAENLVLTARHCVAEHDARQFACTSDGELVPGSVGGRIGPPLSPSSISIRVGAAPGAKVAALGSQIFALPAPSICRHDIALVVLDRPLIGIPVVALRWNSGNLPGEKVRFVGFGEDGQGNIGSRNTRSGIAISMVGSSNFRPQGDAVPARTFMTEGALGCIGDSGGPAFSEQNAVVGVFSQVAGPCLSNTARDFFSQVAPYKEDLLLAAFAAANAEPVMEAGGDGGAPSELPDAGSNQPDAGSSVAGAPGTLPSAGAASFEEEPSYGGPRQAGGCRCHLSSPRAGLLDSEALLALMVCGVAYARRRRPSAASAD